VCACVQTVCSYAKCEYTTCQAGYTGHKPFDIASHNSSNKINMYDRYTITHVLWVQIGQRGAGRFVAMRFQKINILGINCQTDYKVTSNCSDHLTMPTYLRCRH
jgi:V8-like Glu-specific endopeptidase